MGENVKIDDLYKKKVCPRCGSDMSLSGRIDKDNFPAYECYLCLECNNVFEYLDNELYNVLLAYL